MRQSLCRGELKPRINDAYMNEETDPGLFKLMGQAGLLGVTVPEEYGCAGANYVSYGLVAREVERVDFRLSLDDECSILPRHVSDFCLWR